MARRAEQGRAPADPANPEYGRRQPGWEYTQAELPALPAGCPGWLGEVELGLGRIIPLYHRSSTSNQVC